jgi:WD40 repeat protein
VLVAAGPDGLLVTAGGDRILKLWRPATGELLAAVSHPAAITQIEAGDGWSMSRDASETVRVWHHGTVPSTRDGSSIRHGELLRWGMPSQPNSSASGSTRTVARSAPTNQVVTIDADGVLRLQLPASDRREALGIDGAEFRRATFSDTGRMLLTISADGGRLWDARTGIPIGPLLPLPGAVAGLFNETQIVLWSENDARLWTSPELAFDRTAAHWRSWLRGRTGSDRTGEGLLRWLDARDWEPADLP